MTRNIILPLQLDEGLRGSVVDFVYNSPNEYWVLNTHGNTVNRRYCIVSNLNIELSDKVQNLKKSVLNMLGVYNFIEEDIFGNFVGVHTEGGNVHPHTDPLHKDWPHVRINILIQKPIEGGMPVIDDVEYKINQSQFWINKASSWVHSSTVVKGSIDRIVLSLGSYMSNSDFNKIESDVLKNNER